MGSVGSPIKRLRKPLFWLLVCLGLTLLLKWVVVAGYTIPTPSMAPTLYGDPDTGDRVAVFKLHYKLFEPERHDLVVFFREGDFALKPGLLERSGGMNFLKRLVGLPNESIMIQNGELYFGESTPELHRKPLETIRSLLVPVYRARFQDDFFQDWNEMSPGDGARFRLQDGALLCDTRSPEESASAGLIHSRTSGIIRDDYLTGEGELCEGRIPVNDLAIFLEVEFLSDRGELFGVLPEFADRFQFVLKSEAAGGGGEVTSNTPIPSDGLPFVVPTKSFPGFRKGGVYRIRFMNIDNTVRLIVDGEVVAEISYETNTDVQNGINFNVPHFGFREARVLIRKIEIDRDIHYTADRGEYGIGSSYTIPKDHYYFLGDNSTESEDSRVFGPISRENMIGKAFMLFYPFERFRFL